MAEQYKPKWNKRRIYRRSPSGTVILSAQSSSLCPQSQSLFSFGAFSVTWSCFKKAGKDHVHILYSAEAGQRIVSFCKSFPGIDVYAQSVLEQNLIFWSIFVKLIWSGTLWLDWILWAKGKMCIISEIWCSKISEIMFKKRTGKRMGGMSRFCAITVSELCNTKTAQSSISKASYSTWCILSSF